MKDICNNKKQVQLNKKTMKKLVFSLAILSSLFAGSLGYGAIQLEGASPYISQISVQQSSTSRISNKVIVFYLHAVINWECPRKVY